MKIVMRSFLIMTAFLLLVSLFSALSCSITPTSTGYILRLKNDCGGGIIVWLRIYTAPGIYDQYGPYADGTQKDFDVLSGYQASVWDSTHGDFLFYDVGGTIYTLTRNTILNILPGAPPYVAVAVW
ncbi:MAG TPA: hypothetical protein PLO74_03165 [Thermotogota bacterium]|nr:hypothetical protein [Thermotogota bacterium]HPX97125.1 hypothetical protein [Thermotogota bacterium]